MAKTKLPAPKKKLFSVKIGCVYIDGNFDPSESLNWRSQNVIAENAVAAAMKVKLANRKEEKEFFQEITCLGVINKF